MFTQLVVNGIAMGSLYALIALALVLVYKTTKVINFAQSSLTMAATFAAYVWMTSLGRSLAEAALVAIVAGAALGALVEFALLRRAEEPTLLGLIIMTLGIEMFLNAALGMAVGTDTKAFPAVVPDDQVVEFGSVVVSKLNLLIIAVSLSLMAALFAFFRWTTVGVAMMAVSQNPTAARVMGIRVRRIHLLAWALSSALGAITGVLIAPIVLLDPNMMLSPLMKAFAAAVLGGMTSLPGAALGGWILGIVENLVGGYGSAQYKSTVAFAVIILVLILRPEGLLGRPRKKKV